jgi:flagellar biosynthesis protein FliR
MTPTLLNPNVWAFTWVKAVLWVLVLTALAVLLSTVLLPVIPAPAAVPSGIPELVGYMVCELAIGILLGTVVSWILEAVAFAGGLMDMQLGFSFVQLLDPATSQNSSISGSLMLQMAALLVFITGLHHQLILTLVDSYRVAPMGQGLPLQAMGLVTLIGQLLAKGFQLAFPVLAVMFLLDMVLGFSGKFMPQLHLLQLSFPLKISLGMTILGLMLRQLAPWLAPLYESVPRLTLKLLGG